MKDWNDLIEEAVNAMRKARDARHAVWAQYVPDETEASRDYDLAIYKQVCSRDWHLKLQEKFKLHPVVKTLLKQHRPADWQQLLLEWPHISETDQSRLAYTRDEKHGEADRQTIPPSESTSSATGLTSKTMCCGMHNRPTTPTSSKSAKASSI